MAKNGKYIVIIIVNVFLPSPIPHLFMKYSVAMTCPHLSVSQSEFKMDKNGICHLQFTNSVIQNN